MSWGLIGGVDGEVGQGLIGGGGKVWSWVLVDGSSGEALAPSCRAPSNN